MTRQCVNNFSAAMAWCFCLALAGVATIAWAQSTFGTVLGTVMDPSGALVPDARVTLLNTGTNAVRSTVTNPNGGYEFVNVEVGSYKLSIESPGFQRADYQQFELAARSTVRIDAGMKVATEATSVNVEATAVVQTDASNIAETKGSLELTDLPVAIGTRSAGSTSAFSTLTAQPGVQIDNNNNIVVAGALPSQISFTIDGISSVGPGTLGALAELFPSFNSIEEIKISETLNPAEFGGVADITTISKSGTNGFHGGVFENVQNTFFNAADTFSHIVAEDKMNNFGIYLGGPVIFPKLYDGRNKTFFFGSFEVLRLPKTQTAVLSVPTQALRNGDLSAYLAPGLGGSANQLTGYPGNIIPTGELNSYAQRLMSFIYPLPNYGDAGAISNNYLAQYTVPINSAQGDARIDQMFGPKHSVFARWSYKNRRLTTPQGDNYYPNENPSSPLLGGVSRPEIYNSLAGSYNWVVSPSVVNELRGGFSLVHRNVTFGVTAQQAANILGLTVGPNALPQGLPTGDDIPTLLLSGFMGIAGQQNGINPHERTFQLADNLTWTKQKHTLKFGFDWRYLESLFTVVNNNDRLGNYQFNGSVMSALLGSGAATPFASFLLGYPDLTTIGTVVNPNTDAWSNALAFFAQDDFKVTRSLTLNFGLRWEYHPGFRDSLHNMANFDPNYTSTINGQLVKGAVVLTDKQNFANLNPDFVGSVAPTPIITAASVGLPTDLRYISKRDFAPRIGFAWRVGGSNRTVVRGGYGRFIESLLSGSAINGWSMGSSALGQFPNVFNSNGTPIYKMPYSFPSSIAVPGTEYFTLANEFHYKDPIVEMWNVTLERDLGRGIGLRASYDGNHAYNVPTNVNTNQVPVNSAGFQADSTQAAIPFPLLAYIATSVNRGYGNYNAGTISVKKRSSTLQFEVSYTYTRNLANVNGAPVTSAAAFANEFGDTLSDPYHPGLDYGNVPFSRRHRVLATFLYELPFGRNQPLLNGSSVLDKVAGGWQLAGLALFQSGPFMSAALLSDPSGTGYNIFGALTGNGGRADAVPGVSPYAGQSINQWINPDAFADPCATACQTLPNGVTTAVGRFGNSSAGSIVGPGTQAVSLSLIKRFFIRERIRTEIGMQVANAFNHPNYAPPNNLVLGVPAFGQITAMQTAEGAGPRQIQLTGRLTF